MYDQVGIFTKLKRRNSLASRLSSKRVLETKSAQFTLSGWDMPFEDDQFAAITPKFQNNLQSFPPIPSVFLK